MFEPKPNGGFYHDEDEDYPIHLYSIDLDEYDAEILINCIQPKGKSWNTIRNQYHDAFRILDSTLGEYARKEFPSAIFWIEMIEEFA